MLAAHRLGRADQLRVDDAHGGGTGVDRVEAVVCQGVPHGRPLAQLGGEHLGGHGTFPRRVAGPALGRRGVEGDGEDGDAVAARQGDVAPPPLLVEGEGVDDGQQLAP